jgi:hypothetical protein
MYAVHILNSNFLRNPAQHQYLSTNAMFPKMSLFDYPIHFLERSQNREKPLFASLGMSVRPHQYAVICETHQVTSTAKRYLEC